jgi:hypothetical protein
MNKIVLFKSGMKVAALEAIEFSEISDMIAFLQSHTSLNTLLDANSWTSSLDSSARQGINPCRD